MRKANTGSSKPRPAVKSPRTGRPPDIIEGTMFEMSNSDLMPDPSEIVVDGRSPAIIWSAEKRNDLRIFKLIAEKFGLVVQELAPHDDARRSWARLRVDLDYALKVIRDFPGISFDEWAKTWLYELPDSSAHRSNARKKATVALSRLFRDGRVEKRYDGEGNLVLWVAGAAPKAEGSRRIAG
jgi:hypothetical protein